MFWESLSALRNTKDVELFLFDLLTPTERIVLAKRLAIAVLLTKGYGYENIMNILKVSSPTVSRVKAWLNLGDGYKLVIKKILRKETWKEFLEGIEKTLYDLHPYKRHPSDFRKRKIL